MQVVLFRGSQEPPRSSEKLQREVFVMRAGSDGVARCGVEDLPSENNWPAEPAAKLAEADASKLSLKARVSQAFRSLLAKLK